MFILLAGAPARLNAWPWIAALGYDDPNRGLIESNFFKHLNYLCLCLGYDDPNRGSTFPPSNKQSEPKSRNPAISCVFVKSSILLIL